MRRFVLLEHRWNGVHWDFMLETAEGPLRTWAIDAEIVTGMELPARALPDHRAAYLDFEGELSEDRGAVRRVDRGEYELLSWTNDLVKVRLDGAQLFGSVELRRAVSGRTEDSGAVTGWLARYGNFD